MKVTRCLGRYSTEKSVRLWMNQNQYNLIKIINQWFTDTLGCWNSIQCWRDSCYTESEVSGKWEDDKLHMLCLIPGSKKNRIFRPEYARIILVQVLLLLWCWNKLPTYCWHLLIPCNIRGNLIPGNSLKWPHYLIYHGNLRVTPNATPPPRNRPY